MLSAFWLSSEWWLFTNGQKRKLEMTEMKGGLLLSANQASVKSQFCTSQKYRSSASTLTNLPLEKCACCVLPCTLRDVRSDSTNVYSPRPLKVKFRPSNVKKWGSPKADANFKSKRRIKNKQKSQPVTPQVHEKGKRLEVCVICNIWGDLDMNTGLLPYLCIHILWILIPCCISNFHVNCSKLLLIYLLLYALICIVTNTMHLAIKL